MQVGFVVDKKGDVQEPHIIRSSHPGFRDAALNAVSLWKFEPGRKEGVAVSVNQRVDIRFRIEDAPFDTGWEIERPRKFSADVPDILRWDTAPQIQMFNPPVYPREAFLAGKRGRVTIGFVVGFDGRVMQMSPIKGDDAAFIGAAMAAVQTFEFTAPLKNGQPCGAMLSMEFNFKPRTSSDAEVSQEMRRLAKVLKHSPDQIAPLSQLDEGFRPLTRLAPVWPHAHRGATESITVDVEFIVSQRGAAEFPRVVGDVESELVYAAIHAVAGWQFTVPRVNGEPVDALARVPIVFNPPSSEITE